MEPKVNRTARISRNTHPVRYTPLLSLLRALHPDVPDQPGTGHFFSGLTLPLFITLCALAVVGIPAPVDLSAGGGPCPAAEVLPAQAGIMLAQLEEGDIDQSFEAYGDDSDEMIESDEPVMEPVDSLIEGIVWLGHASFLIETERKIYIDPYDIPGELADSLPKADLILVTHDHADHFSAGDIKRIIKPSTVVVSIRSVIEDLPDEVKASRLVEPGDSLTVMDVLIEAVPAYNIEKKFHPREKGYVGFIIHLEDRTVYHAGDTDLIPEMEEIETDIALLPVGGKFTMDPVEAAKAAQIINPEVAIPMHWGKIIGTWEDAKEFQARCKTRVVVLTEIDHASEK